MAQHSGYHGFCGHVKESSQHLSHGVYTAATELMQLHYLVSLNSILQSLDVQDVEF